MTWGQYHSSDLHMQEINKSEIPCQKTTVILRFQIITKITNLEEI